MRVLVTGGAGFIGSWIADRLCQEGHSVLSVDDLSGASLDNVSPDVAFRQVDLTDRSAIPWIAEFAPEVVYALAANAREGASFYQPREIVARNSVATAAAIAGAVDGKALKRFVYFSSMSVYGDSPPPFDESCPCRPVDVYGLSKRMCEEMVRIEADAFGFEHVIIRPHNVFGPRQALFDPYRNVLGIWMNRIMRKQPLFVYGDGDQRRAFSYIEDSIDCYATAMNSPFVVGEAINVGGMRPVTINEMLDVVIDAMGVPRSSIDVQHVGGRHGEVKDAWCTTAKSEALLGYEENIGWESGVYRMAAWARDRGPSDWRWQRLEIDSEMMPVSWRKLL